MLGMTDKSKDAIQNQAEMATKYDPTAIEKGRYHEWLDEGVFRPSGDKKKQSHFQLFCHRQMSLASYI